MVTDPAIAEQLRGFSEFRDSDGSVSTSLK